LTELKITGYGVKPEDCYTILSFLDSDVPIRHLTLIPRYGDMNSSRVLLPDSEALSNITKLDLGYGRTMERDLFRDIFEDRLKTFRHLRDLKITASNAPPVDDQ
jgi:hypothetical protein